MKKELNWTNILFLSITMAVAVFALPTQLIFSGLHAWEFVLFLAMYLLTTMSITAGYHRLFAHRSHEAATWLKIFYLLFGAAAFQGSAADWCSDHRIHHRHVDTDQDPYSIKKGFWFAHVGWLFFKNPAGDRPLAPDLMNNRYIRWQHDFYVPLAIIMGFGLPAYIGLYFGSGWAGLLFGGVARVVLAQHCTFFINSLCHYWGNRSYNLNNTARDNIIMAFLTNGEGYHNFHHLFEADYRNGIYWYHWDPTKWWIKFMSWIGATWRLVQTPEQRILFARLEVQRLALLEKSGYTAEKVEQFKVQIQQAYVRVQELYARYEQLKKELGDKRDQHILDLKRELRLAELQLKFAMRQWQVLMN